MYLAVAEGVGGGFLMARKVEGRAKAAGRLRRCRGGRRRELDVGIEENMGEAENVHM